MGAVTTYFHCGVTFAWSKWWTLIKAQPLITIQQHTLLNGNSLWICVESEAKYNFRLQNTPTFDLELRLEFEDVSLNSHSLLRSNWRSEFTPNFNPCLRSILRFNLDRTSVLYWQEKGIQQKNFLSPPLQNDGWRTIDLLNDITSNCEDG